MKGYFELCSILLFICFVKTFAKVGYRKGFDKKQFIKKVLEKNSTLFANSYAFEQHYCYEVTNFVIGEENTILFIFVLENHSGIRKIKIKR
jgi:hypothetical protein